METLFDKIGGRKFSMGIVLIVAGACVDIFAPNGLSVNLLGLMTAIYAAFSASNTLVTRKQMDVEKATAEAISPAAPAPAPLDPNIEKGLAEIQQLSVNLLPVMTQIATALDNLFKQQAIQSESITTQSQALGKILQNTSR